MKTVRLDGELAFGWSSPAVAVGNFDGVHRGHQALVRAVLEKARPGVVLTFDPPPSRVLNPERAPSALMTLGQKEEILSAFGIDGLAIVPFTPEIARQSPEEFAREILKGALGARIVVVGENFRFGKGRAGDPAALENFGKELGFKVLKVAPVLHEGAPISSTRIREALRRGEVEACAAMLGRPFFVDGLVVRGEGRGRTLSIPTANVEAENDVLPLPGVYAGRCRPEGGGPEPAVINLGQRPTFGKGAMTLEAHILDFSGDLYGRKLRVSFERRLRAERTFPGPKALVQQIETDIEEARRLLESP